MLTLDHPVIAGFLEKDHWPPLLDWLQDEGATLPDLLRLFAGRPPDFVDGLPQEALVEWVRLTCDRFDMRQDKGGVWVMNALSEVVKETAFSVSQTWQTPRTADENTRAAYRLMRSRKRNVLALFPGVVVRQRYLCRTVTKKDHVQPFGNPWESTPAENIYLGTTWRLEDIGVRLETVEGRPVYFTPDFSPGGPIAAEQDTPAEWLVPLEPLNGEQIPCGAPIMIPPPSGLHPQVFGPGNHVLMTATDPRLEIGQPVALDNSPDAVRPAQAGDTVFGHILHAPTAGDSRVTVRVANRWV